MVSNPAHGNLVRTGQDWTYTPTAGYIGNDSFTWRVNDGSGNSNTATVSIKPFRIHIDMPDPVGQGFPEFSTLHPGKGFAPHSALFTLYGDQVFGHKAAARNNSTGYAGRILRLHLGRVGERIKRVAIGANAVFVSRTPRS